MRWQDVVVMSGVVILGGSLLAVAADNNRQLSRQAQCQQNLGSLVKAVNQYSVSNKGVLPDAVVRQQPRWTWWYERIRPEVSRYRDFYCPEKSPEEFDDRQRDPLEPEAWQHRKLAYGMNWQLSADTREKDMYKRSEIKKPGQLVVFGDASFNLLRGTSALWKKDAAPRHDRQMNFAFLDGQVKPLDPQLDGSVSDQAKGILNTAHWRPESQ